MKYISETISPVLYNTYFLLVVLLPYSLTTEVVALSRIIGFTTIILCYVQI